MTGVQTCALPISNQLLIETFSDGLSLTNTYDQYLRRTNLVAFGPGVLSHAIYSYDTASRLASVSDGTNNATYTYLANSPLVSQISFKSNSTVRMTTSKAYDNLNRLSSISNGLANDSPISFRYAYNTANQRTARLQTAFSDTGDHR